MAKFQTLVEALQHWAQDRPHTAAVVFRNKWHERQAMNWATLYTLAGRFATVLRSKGVVDKGTLVVNTLPNCPERVVCEAGIWMAGAASVSGRYLQTDGSDLLATLQRSQAPFLLVDPDIEQGPWHVLKKHVALSKDGTVIPSTTSSSSLPHLRSVVFVRRVENRGSGDFLADLESRGETEEEWFQAEDLSPEDILGVFTTSGTTGFSKLVVHSHGNMLSYLQGSTSYARAFLQQPVQLNLTPMGWIGGSLALFVVPGVTRVACDERAGTPEDIPGFIWRTVQEEQCRSGRFSPVHMPGVVSLAQRALSRHRDDPQSLLPEPWKLTTLLLTGVPVNRAMVRAGLVLAHQVCVLYGATDAGTVASNIVTDSDDFLDFDAGKPFEGIQVKIVNPRNENDELPVNQAGDIAIKTRHLFKGYIHDPETTAAAFTNDEFFKTGDIGRLDERGHLFAEGRENDVIMRGNLIFHPSGLEQRIMQCPAVTAAVVVGVPDAILHEELCVCLLLASQQATVEDVRRYVESIVLVTPSSTVPSYYLKFETFPLTDTGKPRRKVLRSQAAERLGLSFD